MFSLDTELQGEGIHTAAVRLVLERMLSADYFFPRSPLAYFKLRKALEKAVAPLHSLRAGLFPASTQRAPLALLMASVQAEGTDSMVPSLSRHLHEKPGWKTSQILHLFF